jgi:hypothetical protein
MNSDTALLMLLHLYINHRLDEKFSYNDLDQINDFVEDMIDYIQATYSVFMSGLKTAQNYPLKSNKQKKEASHIIIDIVNGYSLYDQSLLTALAYLYQIRQWLKFDITDAINNPDVQGNTETIKVAVNSIKDEQAKQNVLKLLTGDNEVSKIRSAILNINDQKPDVDEWIDTILS